MKRGLLTVRGPESVYSRCLKHTWNKSKPYIPDVQADAKKISRYAINFVNFIDDADVILYFASNSFSKCINVQLRKY